jgi:AAA ATPase domain
MTARVRAGFVRLRSRLRRRRRSASRQDRASVLASWLPATAPIQKSQTRSVRFWIHEHRAVSPGTKAGPVNSALRRRASGAPVERSALPVGSPAASIRCSFHKRSVNSGSAGSARFGTLAGCSLASLDWSAGSRIRDVAAQASAERTGTRDTGIVSVRVSSSIFVGRGIELAELDAALADTAAGRPSMVVIAGDSGVGKTRLLSPSPPRGLTWRGAPPTRPCITRRPAPLGRQWLH